LFPTIRPRLITRYRRRVAAWIIGLGLGLGLGVAAPWSLAGGSPWFPDVPPGSACQVNSVHDADTLRATCNGQKVKIHLYCIDAPEMAQRPWGQESRDYLRRLIPQQISIRQRDRDRYGRLVAEVFGHAGKNINLALVEAGQAAVYPRYCRDSPYFDAQKLADQPTS
jgi:endonuclease YncB( thermonuclease family)